MISMNMYDDISEQYKLKWSLETDINIFDKPWVVR